MKGTRGSLRELISHITPEKSDSSRPHWVGFDAVRAVAVVAVVVLHALVPYLKHPMPGLVWSVSVMDEPSALADGVFWSIELFVMPLFLVIAGFFAYGTYAKKGAGALASSRAKRLLRPLLFGLVVIIPLDLYIWVLGWVAEGWVTPRKLKTLKFDGVVDKDFWGLSHLWFLHYLFSYIVLFALAAKVYSRWPKGSKAWVSRFCLSLPAVVAVGWAVAATVIYLHPEVIWGFQHDFAPVPSKWIYNGVFFMIGLAIARVDPAALRWRSFSLAWSAVAIGFVATTVPFGLEMLEGTSNQSHGSRMMLALMTASSSLLASLMIVGMALRYIRAIPVAIQYLAAASFWIYLVHHPILGLVHIDLKWMLPDASPILKATLATTITLVGSLLTFECFVRRSKAGRWLGMAWAMPLR
ncbi:MAG: acyltransferase [Algisphaera sp.]